MRRPARVGGGWGWKEEEEGESRGLPLAHPLLSGDELCAENKCLSPVRALARALALAAGLSIYTEASRESGATVPVTYVTHGFNLPRRWRRAAV